MNMSHQVEFAAEEEDSGAVFWKRRRPRGSALIAWILKVKPSVKALMYAVLEAGE
jgi:hypothetical protein